MSSIKIFPIALVVSSIAGTVGAMPVADEFKDRALGSTEVSPSLTMSVDVPILSEHLIIAALCIAVLLLSVAVVWLINDRRRQHNRIDRALRAESSEKISVEHITFGVAQFQNIGKRKEQQDSFYFSDPVDAGAKGLLAVVADGMGGMQGGATISRIVASTFREQFEKTSTPEPKNFLLETARQAETAVENHIMRTRLNGGSTLVAVMITGDQLYFISVGDSRIYLLHGGKLIQLNEEHTYGAQLLKKAALGEISKSEALNDPDRHALIAYVGMGSFNIVDRNEKSIRLEPNDKILLCSDGVFNALDNEELIAALHSDASSAARLLEKNISELAIPDQDNFTGIIIEFRAEQDKIRG